MRLYSLLWITFFSFVASAHIFAQTAPLPADLIDDEGGAVRLEGQLRYTYPFFTTGVSDPVIVLEDQAGFITRNDEFIVPLETQVLGQITSDFRQSPFTYQLQLPAEPLGTRIDASSGQIDNGGAIVFAITYWQNMFGNMYIEERDRLSTGWRQAYTSARISGDRATEGEVIGGTFIVYAPETDLPFPISFGNDGRLFTEDDPLALLPAGYTVVRMDETPFTFDRRRLPTVDILENELFRVDDFSRLSYHQAFDAMLDKFRREYAFTDYKNIDWDELAQAFRPRFATASQSRDVYAYLLALRDFTLMIPDDHIDSNLLTLLAGDFLEDTAGGIGIALAQDDAGRVIAQHVSPPADEAGIMPGAEILTVNGLPVLDHVSAALTWGGPYSSPHVRQLQKLRYATRFTVDETVTLTYRNPQSAQPTETTLIAIQENESFLVTSFNVDRTGVELPIMWERHDSGYLLVRLLDFQDDRRLTIQLWERMLNDARRLRVPGIVLDIRNNQGGSGWLADQMAAYFFDEPHLLGRKAFYDPVSDTFTFQERDDEYFIPPPEAQRYAGPIALLIGPNCASACEFFAHNMTTNDRAALIGHYPTSGMGGSVERFFMPEGVTLQLTTGRAVNADGRIHIEGTGIAPTLRVPVTQATLLSQNDTVLQAAIDHLNGR